MPCTMKSIEVVAAIIFELTNAQKRVIREIPGDMKSGKQMNRFLQGNVEELYKILTASLKTAKSNL